MKYALNVNSVHSIALASCFLIRKPLEHLLNYKSKKLFLTANTLEESKHNLAEI